MSKTYRNRDGKKRDLLKSEKQRQEKRRRPKGIFVIDPVADYDLPSSERRTA